MVSLCVTIIVGTSNNFTIVRLPNQRSKQKLLQFGWFAPDFTPKMSLAWAIPKQGDRFHSIMLEGSAVNTRSNGGMKEHVGYCPGLYQSV